MTATASASPGPSPQATSGTSADSAQPSAWGRLAPCQLSAGQDPARFVNVSRRLWLNRAIDPLPAGSAFWRPVGQRVERDGASIPALPSRLHSEEPEHREAIPRAAHRGHEPCQKRHRMRQGMAMAHPLMIPLADEARPLAPYDTALGVKLAERRDGEAFTLVFLRRGASASPAARPDGPLPARASP